MKQKSGRRNTGGSGRITIWIVTAGVWALILVGLIVGGVFLAQTIFSGARDSVAFARIDKVLDRFDEPMSSRDVSRLDPKYRALLQGPRKDITVTIETVGPNEDRAAQEIAKDIEHLPAYCRDLAERKGNRSSNRLALLSGLIPRFPGTTSVKPLLRMPAGSPTYEASINLVKQRMSRQSLIEASCDGDEQIRKFSARVLAMSMPFGKLDGPGEIELAARTSAVAKQQTFERLYAAAHQAVESRLVGRYRLRIDAVWKTAEEVVSPVGLATVQPVVDVSCTGRTWAITLGDQVWSGVIDDIPTATLKTRVSSVAAEVSRLPGFRPDTELCISGGEQGLAAAVSPVALYAPGRDIRLGFSQRVDRYEPAKDGYEKFAAILVR